MSLSVGIVGLPNVGKSTLFNALLHKQQAYVANFPFATIEPNVGVVPVPDERLPKLAEIYNAPIVPATVKFIDIAGLISGAHKGEGLGNKFLSHIREVDVILHVIRHFEDSDVLREGSIDPKSDYETIKTELELADLATKEKREKAKKKIDEELQLLSDKKELFTLNVSESDLKNTEKIESDFAKQINVEKSAVIAICAKVEEELTTLSENDRLDYLHDLGVEKSGLERLIQRAFTTLGLISFLTAGEKEVRSWTVSSGTLAPQAAGVIHTDFEKKFIKADVCKWTDFVELGGRKHAREQGKVRTEGRDYQLRDGDVVEFKIGS